MLKLEDLYSLEQNFCPGIAINWQQADSLAEVIRADDINNFFGVQGAIWVCLSENAAGMAQKHFFKQTSRSDCTLPLCCLLSLSYPDRRFFSTGTVTDSSPLCRSHLFTVKLQPTIYISRSESRPNSGPRGVSLVLFRLWTASWSVLAWRHRIWKMTTSDSGEQPL